VPNFVFFSSTAAVYGNASDQRLPEDAPLPPLSPYGSSKLLTEVMLRGVAAAHCSELCGRRAWRSAEQGRT
jgi:UDP-glucose 4-epimerase